MKDTKSLLRAILFLLGFALFGMGAACSAPFAYISNAGSNNVSVIDTTTNTVVAVVPKGSGGSGIAVNPAGNLVYAANYNDRSVSVIDTGTYTMIATITVGTVPLGVAFNPAGTFAYVGNIHSANNLGI